MTTSKSKDFLEQLPHVTSVTTRATDKYLLHLDDPSVGPELFQIITAGNYIEEFSQQPPTLDTIFRMEAGATYA